MIEAIPKGEGRISTVRAICDECGRGEIVTCDYDRVHSGDWRPNEGQALRKIGARGWAVVKGKLHCPTCEAKRKAFRQEVNTMAETKVTEIRKPTREQKRQIIDMLEEVYDTDAGRYKGSETDVSVASVLGDGIMSGWVSDLREDLFGPDGGNGDMDALADEIRDWIKSADKTLSDLSAEHQKFIAHMRDANEAAKKVREFGNRLDALKRAVGPRAMRA